MQRNGKVWPIQRETKQLLETVPEEPQMLDIIDKDCKLTIIRMFKELKIHV